MCTVVHSCCKNASTTGIKYNSYTTGKYLIRYTEYVYSVPEFYMCTYCVHTCMR